MIIVGLVRKGKKVKIFFEDNSFIVVNYEIALDSGLRKNDEIDEKQKEELIRKNSFFEIKNAAFRFLSRRLHSARELHIKLTQKKFDKELIDLVISDLSEKKYLDDYEFMEKYISEKLLNKKVGSNKIKAELLRKGIDREVIESVLTKYSDSPVIFSNALEIAKKKLDRYRQKGTDDRVISQKIYHYLQSKGYQYDIISRVINQLKIGEY